MDRDEGVGAVEFAAEQAAEFNIVKGLEDGGVLVEHFLAGECLGIAVGFVEGEFLEDGEIVDLTFDGEERIDLAAEGGDLLDGALGAFLVIPKIRGAHGLVELG